MCELLDNVLMHKLNNINIKFSPTVQQACQYGGKKSKKDYAFSLGKSSTANWKVNSLDPLDFSVTYHNGDPSTPNGKTIYRYFSNIIISIVKVTSPLLCPPPSPLQVFSVPFCV